MNNVSTLICFALKEEAASFRKLAYPRHGPDLAIRIVGIGRANAEKSIREFLNACRKRDDDTQTEIGNRQSAIGNFPELVLTCGFAGGLNPGLKLGDVVFEIPVQTLTPALSHPMGEGGRRTGEGLYDSLLAAGAKPVKFFCADRIATTVAEKNALRGQTGADAVEMESAAIHAVCAERGIPCATVRVISDTANEDLPLDFNALSKPDKSLDFGKLAWAIAKAPGKIGALMELQKKTSFAARQLAEVLAKFVSQ